MIDNDVKKALEDWIKDLKDDYKRLQLLDAPMDCFEESHVDSIRVLSNALDLINRKDQENETLKVEVERLKTIAKKMHTWIFLNSCDEEKAYAECGLTDEENALLGYCGKIVFENKEMVGEDNG